MSLSWGELPYLARKQIARGEGPKRVTERARQGQAYNSARRTTACALHSPQHRAPLTFHGNLYFIFTTAASSRPRLRHPVCLRMNVSEYEGLIELDCLRSKSVLHVHNIRVNISQYTTPDCCSKSVILCCPVDILDCMGH